MPTVINFAFTKENSHTWEKSPWFFNKRLGMYTTEHASEKGHVYVCIYFSSQIGFKSWEESETIPMKKLCRKWVNFLCPKVQNFLCK